MGEHERSLQSFARFLLRDVDLALDCVQETFLRAYESLDRGRTVNKHWLFVVARSRAMDEFRRRRLHARHASQLAPPIEGVIETSMTVRQTMDRLTPQHREVLYLFAVAGFTSDEIARLLRITGPAVRQRLYRARQQFRRAYGDTSQG
jgi:RNA polymerase sigma-70 factor (ECF subfamily)